MTCEFNMAVVTDDPTFVKDLFGSPTVTEGTKVAFSGIEIELSSVKVKPGITSSELIVNVIISITTGVAASLIANIIWQKLGLNGKHKLVNKEKRTTLIKREDYEIFFSEEIETHSEKDL